MASVNFKDSSDVTWLDSTDVSWISAIADTIIIGNATITISGQAVLANNPINVSIGNSSLTLAGQTILLTTGINPANASITCSGQAISFGWEYSTIVPNASIIIGDIGPEVFVWGIPPSFVIEELVPNPEKEPGHDPCGHWHLGIADEPIWDFVEQPDLPIPYHEHPTKPEVCGHWHKEDVSDPIIPCIEYLDQVDFDDYPSYSRHYASAYGGEYLWVGSDAGVLLKIDPTDMSIVQRTAFAGGVIDSIKQIEYFDDKLYIGCSISGSSGWFIQKVTAAENGVDFVVIGDPIYAGSVVRGSDGNVYGAMISARAYGSYATSMQPITGGLWWTAYERIMDDYAYYIYASHAAIGTNASGAAIQNFKVIDTDSFIARRSTSALISNTSTASRISFAGIRLGLIVGTNINSPGVELNPDHTQAVVVRNVSAGTGTTVDWMSLTGGGLSLISSGAVSGLLDYDGSSRDNGIYHIRAIWHTNNRVYYYGSLYPGYEIRIWSIIPGTFNVLHQYMTGLTGGGDFTIMGDYVYIMQAGLKNPVHSSAWIKLDLDLNFICLEDCVSSWAGDYEFEKGNNITNDGEQYIFNYASNRHWVSPPTYDAVVTKYYVAPIITDDAHGATHDPRWDFTRQSNI